MVKAHADAILSLLRSIPHVTVYDGEVPDRPALPYVVAWTSAPQRMVTRLSGGQDHASNVFRTTVTAQTPESVRIVQDHVHAALLGTRIAVPGRATQRVRHDDADLIRKDEDVDPPLFYGADAWAFQSTPA